MTELLLRRFVPGYKNEKDPEIRTAIGSMAGWVGIFCNFILVVGKLIVGFFSGSISIIADGLNNLLDAAGAIIALAGFKISSKKADNEHPFGHGRYEYISGLAVAALVLVVGVELGKTSIKKLFEPTPVDFGVWSFIVLVVSVLIKIWLTLFYRNLSRRICSTTLKATATDSFGDVITTSAVLITAVLSRLFSVNLDGWAGVVVAAFIIYNGFGLIKDTLSPLLGEPPSQDIIDYIYNKIASYEYVLSTHDLIVHDYGPGRRFASAHVEISSDVDPLVAHDVIDKIERDFVKEENIHLIIHYDPVITGDQTGIQRAWIEQQLKAIDGRLSIHDLRIVDCSDQIECIFDVVMPKEVDMTEEELKNRIQQAAKYEDKPVIFTVKIDRSYLDRFS